MEEEGEEEEADHPRNLLLLLPLLTLRNPLPVTLLTKDRVLLFLDMRKRAGDLDFGVVWRQESSPIVGYVPTAVILVALGVERIDTLPISLLRGLTRGIRETHGTEEWEARMGVALAFGG